MPTRRNTRILAEACRARSHRIIRFGRKSGDLRLASQRPDAGGQQLALEVFGQRANVFFPVAGSFQAENLLAALGLVIAEGEAAEAALGTVGKLSGVHGRIEHVASLANGAPVYVDYAHKPAALEAVLTALRPHATGKLFVIFGCGGDRDRGKRPQMGEIAERLADTVIVTDDNPRSEDPASIRAEIMAATRHAREIGDRRLAIRTAVGELSAGDLLVIAGKGHETGQTVGGVTPALRRQRGSARRRSRARRRSAHERALDRHRRGAAPPGLRRQPEWRPLGSDRHLHRQPHGAAGRSVRGTARPQFRRS